MNPQKSGKNKLFFEWSRRGPSIESLLEYLRDGNQILITELITNHLDSKGESLRVEAKGALDDGQREHVPEGRVAEVERGEDGFVVEHGGAWPAGEEQDAVLAEQLAHLSLQ